MPDEAAQLKRAQELVKSGDYDEARSILVTMPDHPTAQKWLKQLDERHPIDADGDDATLRRAQALIEAEQYEDARALLVSLPHNDTAQKWLVRLDNLDRTTQGANKMSDDQTPNPIPTPTPSVPGKNAADYTVPMIPQVADIVDEQIIKRLGKVGGVAAVGALLYGVSTALMLSIGADNAFVNAILGTLFTALVAYGIAFALSLAFPKIPRNTFFIFVGFTCVVTFIALLTESQMIFSFFNTSFIVGWFWRVLLGVGIAYLFAKANRFVPAQGEPRLSRNLFIVTAIALVAIFGSAGGTGGIISTFVVGTNFGFGGLGLGDFIGGLLGGLIVGALMASVLAIALSESE